MFVTLLSGSLLLVGDHYHISQAIFLAALFFWAIKQKSVFKFRISSLTVGSSLVCLSTLLMVPSALHLIYIILLFIIISKEVIPLFTGFRIFTIVHLVFAWTLYVDTIVSNGHPWFGNWFCIYGNRTQDACYVHSYVVNNIAFARLYGLSSEPASYALFLSSQIFLHVKYKLNETTFLSITNILFLTLLFTFSFVGYGVLLSLLIFDRETRKFFRLLYGRNLFKLLIALLLIVISYHIFNFQKTDILSSMYHRVIRRLVHVLSGEDISALLRTYGTWYPVIDLFSQTTKGLGLHGVVDYVASRLYVGSVDGKYFTYSGQVSSVLAYFLLAFGAIYSCILTFFALYYLKIKRTLLYLCFLLGCAYPLSSGPFVLLLFIKLRKKTA